MNDSQKLREAVLQALRWLDEGAPSRAREVLVGLLIEADQTVVDLTTNPHENKSHYR